MVHLCNNTGYQEGQLESDDGDSFCLILSFFKVSYFRLGSSTHCENCSRWFPTEKTEKGSLLNRTSCPLKDSIRQRTEMN